MDWQARHRAHEARADGLTAGHRRRAQEGRTHPVEDFLFTYYPVKPARLRRWHPGADLVLAGAAARERLSWRWYAEVPGGVAVDGAAFAAARGDGVRFVRDLLAATAARPAQLGCFGLHEWAMAYRAGQDGVRHASQPLRLGAAGTDGVVEASRLRCTHFDAFRFFTEAARPRNAQQLDRGSQVASEQPGCLHAAMDAFKWAWKLSPAVPGELLLDCFELARDARVLDMRASPYDLADLGYEPVRIETAEGRAQYVHGQREIAFRGQALRRRLLAVCDGLLEHAPATTS